MGSDKMGSDLVWIDVSPSDFFGETVFSLISSVPSSMVQKAIWFLVGLPLCAWFWAVACILLSIQAVRGGKTYKEHENQRELLLTRLNELTGKTKDKKTKTVDIQ